MNEREQLNFLDLKIKFGRWNFEKLFKDWTF